MKTIPSMPISIGLLLVRYQELRIRDHVVHVGPSLPLPPSNHLKESRDKVKPHSLSNNLLIVQDHSVIRDVMVVGWTKPSNMSLRMVLPILPHIHMLPVTKPVRLKEVHTRSPVSRMPLKETVMPSSMIWVEDHFQSPLMLLTGHSMPVVSSETVIETLTMVSS
jgi:hypothetical protein